MTDDESEYEPLPEKLDEVYWLLISLMSLEPEEQIKYLRGRIPMRDEPDARRDRRNPTTALHAALATYFNYWWDAFAPNVQAADEFEETRYRLAESKKHPDEVGIFCHEEFFDGESWQKLRALAKSVLREAGLEPYPISRPIDFAQLVESHEL